MVNGAIARREGPSEAEKALNDSHGIHKFSPALLSSRMPRPRTSVRLDAKIALCLLLWTRKKKVARMGERANTESGSIYFKWRE